MQPEEKRRQKEKPGFPFFERTGKGEEEEMGTSYYLSSKVKVPNE
jgi:hypothetical protein